MSTAALILMGAAALVVAIVWLVGKAQSSRMANPIVDQHTLSTQAGYTSERLALRALLGRMAQADTDLKPQGFILIDGQRLDALTGGEYIERGAALRVERIDGNVLIVRRWPELPPPGEA